MTDIPLYQVDAFTSKAFGGNPAAVCPLDTWLDEQVMQSIALENNLSETAFFKPRPDGDYDLRWFTPVHEVDLCGHATLASGHVILELLDKGRDGVTFHTRSGALTVARENNRLTMSFPAWPAEPAEIGDVAGAIGLEPEAVLTHTYAMAVLRDAEAVIGVRPDFARIAALKVPELIITAPGEDADFVSRFFAPRAGIPEDPVTGSAHCTLIPYWSAKLGKTEMFARQVSQRGGEIYCRDEGERVRVGGEAVLVIEGTFKL